MQQLHLVGYTTDRKGLVLSARKGAKTGAFVVHLDAKVLKAVSQVQKQRDERANGSRSSKLEPRPESILTPREIQTRLRAGRSIEKVAVEAGVDAEWIERFAPPVRAEQIQVVEMAHALVFSKPRLGDSAAPLGAAVERHLAEKGVELGEVGTWTASYLRNGNWLVRFAFRHRGSLKTADWEVDLKAGELHARNRLAGELAYVEAGRRKAVPSPATSVARSRRAQTSRPRPAKAAKRTTKAPARRATAASGAKKRPATRKAASRR